MRPILPVLLLFLGSAAGSAVRAQGEQLVLDPPLSRAFPLQSGPGGVHVPYPVLLNDHTILRPDARLRFVYIDSNAGIPRRAGDDDDGSGFHTKEGPGGTLTRDPSTEANVHGEGPMAAWGSNPDDDTSGLFDVKKEDAKGGKKELQEEVWNQPALFTEAFDHATEVGTTFVYSPPAQSRPQTTALDLPEGMLLAEVGGQVRVLALDPNSHAYVAGIRAGDEIRSFGGGPPLAGLEDFIRTYAATKHHARLSGNPAYELDIWRAGEGRVIPVQIAAPPTIPSFL